MTCAHGLDRDQVTCVQCENEEQARERRHADRRVSPAVGDFAIQECARLRALNAALLAALRDMIAIIEGVDEYQRHPDRGNPDAECACCMGEMFDMEEADMVQRARAAIAKAQP